MSSIDIYSTIQNRVSAKYSNINLEEYIKFCIDNSLNSKEPFETANHHILPKWAFPEFASFYLHPWNKSILSHRNHLKAHLLLWESWKAANNATPLN